MAGAMLLTEDRLPWWVVLPLAVGLGLFFGTAMWFERKYMKARRDRE
jgi:hypothetical protein